MTYRGPNDSTLPGQVPRMPKRLRETWVKTYNEQLEAEPDDEQSAARFAYKAVRHQRRIEKQIQRAKAKAKEDEVRKSKAIELSEWKNDVWDFFVELFGNSWWPSVITDEYVIAKWDTLAVDMGAPMPPAPKHHTYRVNYTAERETAEDGESEVIVKIDFASRADWIPVVQTYSAVTLMASKEKGAPRRWLGVSSGGFEDREGEIVSSAFLDDCLARAEKSQERGDLRIWHIPGSRVGSCDFQAMHEGFLLESGHMDDTPSGRNATEWMDSNPDARLSIQFAYENRSTDGVYSPPGQILERSILPSDAAAFPWASITMKEFTMSTQINDEKRAALEEIIGSEEAEAVLVNLADGSTVLKEANVRFKELDTDASAETETEEDGADDADVEADIEEEDDDEEVESAVEEKAVAPEEFSFTLNEKSIEVIASAVAEKLLPSIEPLTADQKELRSAVKELSAEISELSELESARVAEKAANMPRATVRRIVRPTKAKAKEEIAEKETPANSLEIGTSTLYG